MLTLEIPRHVHHRSDLNGSTVLLDTSAGVWFVLNRTGGQLWRAWADGADFDQGVAMVATTHDGVPLDTVRNDARGLLGELTARNLVTVITPSASAAAEMVGQRNQATMTTYDRWVRSALTIAAVPLLALCALLARCSFRAAVALVRSTRHGWCRRAPGPEFASNLAAAVGRSASLYPGRAACLEQSLCCVLLAAVFRRELRWCLGSAADPYRFHAWAQRDGSPVVDPEYPMEHAAFQAALTV